MTKEEYVDYYRQALGMECEDFAKFCTSIGNGLPYAFRITKTPLASIIRTRVEKYPFVRKVGYLEDVYEFNKEKERSGAYKEFTGFLVDQTGVGLIQRQEVVSMIPVLLMDLHEGLRVLDMCAAPGSKTKQILEVVTDGLVVANDVNGKRLKVLVSETTKRPNGSLVVTRHDAAMFPRIYGKEGQVLFDRVFCDVVCSSDGTVRKNPELLDDWRLSRGARLFDTQYKILRRGCDLVEDGGLVSYSTCSLNPLENECVVQKVLLEGNFELVDFRGDSRLALFPCASDGKRLVFREGLRTWGGGDALKGLDGQPSSEDLGLEKCIRLYPHDQDTGGFFIAILRRKEGSTRNPGMKKAGTPFQHFMFLSQEAKGEIMRTYPVDGCGELYRKTERSKTISTVSRMAAEVLQGNQGLNVVSAGYRILEKSGLEHSEFYVKNVFHMGGSLRCDFGISLEQFKLLLEDTFVSNALLGFEHSGLAIVRVEEMGIALCGYGADVSFTLFMNNNLRKALKGLVP